MSFLVSIRISGDDVRGSELVRQFDPHLEALLENLRSVPGVEVECFMSQEKDCVAVDATQSFTSKPRINDNPMPLSSAVNGRIYAELGRYGFTTLNQLAWMSRREIGYIVGIAKKSLDIIEEQLGAYDLQFLPDGMSLSQRDWKFLPVRALILTRLLPESIFPRRIDYKLELGRYLDFSDERIAGMLGDINRAVVPSPYSEEVKKHREFISRVRLLVS